MKLTFFRGKAPNFGDELNAYMWPLLLPRNFLDEDEDELFVGIGSILLDTMPAAPLKHVMGSGYAGYTAPPPIHDGSWNVVFVRGPRTAAALGLPRETAICDSAILLRALELPAPTTDVGIAFMPHYESLARGNWVEACELAGITLIDPRHDVEPVIAAIRGARLLITEAMHGAIVADALRTPWIPVLPIHPRHHGKWLDWADSLSIELRPHRNRPTSLMELYVAMSGGRGNIEGRAGRASRSRLAAPANKALTFLAAERLRKLARLQPQLSSDRKIEEATARAMDALDRFVRSRHPAYGALSA
jgi:succinoglycan biosynthesis protein ExoV